MNSLISSTERNRPVVIGAGIGGLATGLRLAIAGCRPIILERSAEVGGKAHRVPVGEGLLVDGGPTVMTMLPVFEELYAAAGERFQEHVQLSKAEILARHFWDGSDHFDLFADLDRATEEVRRFAGAREAEGFVRFHDYAAQIYESVKDLFIYAPKPSPVKMLGRLGFSMIPTMIRASVHRKMWPAIAEYFQDERLRQLYGRYATYAGNNPFLTPATFNLIAAVEQQGVWRVQGGIHALAESMRSLIIARGGVVETESEVEELLVQKRRVVGVRLRDQRVIQSEQVVFNGDVQALSAGRLGESARAAVRSYPKRERSLSALTLCAAVDAPRAPLLHHNVYFSRDYRQEFRELESGQLPVDPTIYLCAQDRGDQSPSQSAERDASQPERLFALINAPARGDEGAPKAEEIERCQDQLMTTLQSLKVKIRRDHSVWTTPQKWDQRFPHSGGAIYGMVTRRWDSNLKRMGARSKLKGLYLAGGTVHPGAGVPMAAISGKIAADAVIQDSPLIERSPTMAISGGI